MHLHFLRSVKHCIYEHVEEETGDVENSTQSLSLERKPQHKLGTVMPPGGCIQREDNITSIYKGLRNSGYILRGTELE